MRIRLPNNWQPRDYQRPAWDYLERGGRHAELIWHRRSGKDEISLHRTAVAAFERVASYWHMLPLAVQVRKAIWSAINPHTGKRRIDEAFPLDLRESTRDQDMFIKFRNGSTWQALGSDNFDAMVGSPPAGIVYSEWALANPSARAYLRPIIAENNGWQIFITTPRGKNHAERTFRAAQREPGSFAQLLTAEDTGVFLPAQLQAELRAYMDDFGEDQGRALYEQEYLCSFEAAILGSYYGKELADARNSGRICAVPYQSEVPVFAAFDIGWSDDTAIWFWQLVGGEIHVIDYYANHNKGVDHYVEVLGGKGYGYQKLGDRPFIWLPHDARAKTFAASGKSTQQQFAELGYESRIVPNLSLQDGVQAARKTFPKCWFDADRCDAGLDALGQYRREWDEDKKCFRDQPVHDWTSHPADAFRYLSIAWQTPRKPKPEEPARWPTEMTINELIERQRRKAATW